MDEPPVLEGPDTVDDFPENSSTSRQVGRYTASDPEGLGRSVAAVGRRQVRDGQSDGFRFTARHPDNVNMTYRVGGNDQQFFMVDSPTGQLKTSDIPVDRETLPGSEAEVVITVTAPDNHTAATTVTVTIIDE